ncbi:MAG TPA: PQQ-binding-like beta-propeller repeat protein [Tepidisphaeraceae bacterium]|nr:PQQ-binding-like beta-propeller repeat protein [Tepidisphaeraceae bacterium]
MRINRAVGVCVGMLWGLNTLAADAPLVGQQSAGGITHSFLATGGQTFVVGEDGKETWRWPGATRDGWVLANGNVLLAAGKSKAYPAGAVVEVDKAGKTVWEFKGTQSEVDAVQPLAGGNVLLTESGPKPRLMEVTREGKVAVEFGLQCQTKSFHMQTRMARKLVSGNYLVPHLLDRVVREYDKAGKTVWEFRTPDEPKESWPFTAIRLENGNTLVTCTHGNMVIEVDQDGKELWRVTNQDLGAPLLKDPCGAQRLANGNTVIASYGAGGADEVKLLEVTPERKVVWTYTSGRRGGVHEVHVLTTNGKAEGGGLR